MKQTNDEYNIHNYINDDLIFNYYKNVNTDFLNNTFKIPPPYIQILSYYKNPILRFNSQLDIYLNYDEKTTNNETLNYLMELYFYSLDEIKITEIVFIKDLNEDIKRIIEIFIYAGDNNDKQFKTKEFLTHKTQFMELLALICNIKKPDINGNYFNDEILKLIHQTLTENLTVKMFYTLETTDKFIIDLLTYIKYKTEFISSINKCLLRKIVENYDHRESNKIDIPPISKTFKFNNLVLFQEGIIEDFYITYSLIQVDIINLIELKQKTKKNKKYKNFISIMETLKENDFSLTTLDPFIKKYRRFFDDFINYINDNHKQQTDEKRNKYMFFVPYCITHIIKKYEIYKFIKSVNPLLKLKKDIPILKDDELIILFCQNNKTKKKQKKQKNKNIVDISNLSNEDIIFIEEEIEKIENTQLEELKEKITEEINEEINADNESDESDDEEGFKVITYKTVINEFDYYDIVFNNIYISNKNIIEILIYKLYDTNHNFLKLMKNYNIIRIIKDIHKDSFFLNETLHFNAMLINSKNGVSTSPLHFYISNNTIVNITQVVNLI